MFICEWIWHRILVLLRIRKKQVMNPLRSDPLLADLNCPCASGRHIDACHGTYETLPANFSKTAKDWVETVLEINRTNPEVIDVLYRKSSIKKRKERNGFH